MDGQEKVRRRQRDEQPTAEQAPEQPAAPASPAQPEAKPEYFAPAAIEVRDTGDGEKLYVATCPRCSRQESTRKPGLTSCVCGQRITIQE